MLYIENNPYYLLSNITFTISTTYRYMLIYMQKYIFSNGQVYHYSSLLWTWIKRFFFVSLDFFSNKLWVILDQPKIFRHLIQFFHRYVGAVPAGVITSEVVKRRL